MKGWRRLARLLLQGWLLQVRQMSRSIFELMTAIILPLIFATLAFYVLRAGGSDRDLMAASIGAGMMGTWSTVLFGAGSAIDRQRWEGTLELLIAAPAPFIVVLLSLTLATTTVGIYALPATMLWGWALFDVPLHFAHPLAFVAAVPATIVALGTLGLLMATTFVVLRNANAINNMGEFPIWLLSGALVPIAVLPGWLHPVSWVLAPTWGVRALREAALGGAPWQAIGLCCAIAIVQMGLAAVALRHVERRARAHATLALT
jgi:ABC-2 type transport system permease protein